jgi:hypothetical protein
MDAKRVHLWSFDGSMVRRQHAIPGEPFWAFFNAFGTPTIGYINNTAHYSNIVGTTLAQVVEQKCDEVGLPR